MRQILALCLVLCLFMPAVGAEEAERAQAIRSVISAQIEAFKRDDGAVAFSYASPDIQVKFRDPKAFMSMVATAYPQVHRPQSVEFGELVGSDAVYVQKVLLRGPKGKLVLALYEMVLIDERWWINGCTLAAVPGKEI